MVYVLSLVLHPMAMNLWRILTSEFKTHDREGIRHPRCVCRVGESETRNRVSLRGLRTDGAALIGSQSSGEVRETPGEFVERRVRERRVDPYVSEA